VLCRGSITSGFKNKSDVYRKFVGHFNEELSKLIQTTDIGRADPTLGHMMEEVVS